MAEQDTKEIPEQSNIEPTTAGPDVFPIVGIGMSAGGLEGCCQRDGRAEGVLLSELDE